MSISAIKLKGGYFKEDKQFQFFNNHKQVATIIYGKNGSGKSSLARAFQEVFNPTSENEFSNIELFQLREHPKQGLEPLPITNITMPCYVHNENYTHQTVSFNDNGLETIVMFGEQIDINSEIDILNQELEGLKSNYEISKNTYDKLLDPTFKESHLYILEQIKKKLKTTWASRYQKITGNKTAGRVDNSLINEILNYNEINETTDSLTEVLKTNLQKYKKLSTANYIDELSSLRLPNEIKNLTKFLATELQEPLLTDKEKKILDIYNSLNNQDASKSLDFLKSTNSICHTCFQPVDPQHKTDILDTIRKILNTDEANNLIKQISDIKPQQIHLNISHLDKIVEEHLISSLNIKIEKLNLNFQNLDEERKNKINNPYKPINPHFDVELILNDINKIIDKVNIQIIEFNKAIKKKNKALDDLKSLNKKLAYVESKDLIKIYKEKLLNFNELKKEKEFGYNNINRTAEKIKKKRAALANVEIALELINSYLQYIFYDEKRLYLVSSFNSYTIMSRDEPVKPSSLSVGEKNIISLCYFFSTLFKNENISELFKKECILILDDPLSSFDFENKVGVYSFLRYILNELHTRNTHSKSIIYTHDLDVLYNMTKVFSDIEITERNKKIKLFHLCNQNLEGIDSMNYDEYSRLLQNIYDFVIDDSVNDLNLGNNLRRVLEAFATFNYKCGIEELTRNPDILEKIPVECRSYFSNSMYRLILNTESHLGERSKLILSTSFKEHFSIDEKTRTAKDILMFLYFLNPVHLKSHLNKDGDVSLKIAQIDSWIKETFSSSNSKIPVSI